MSDLEELGSIKYLTVAKLSELAIPAKPFYKRGMFWAICCSTILILSVCILLVIIGCKRCVHLRMRKMGRVPNEDKSEVPEEQIELTEVSTAVNDDPSITLSRPVPTLVTFSDSLFGKKFGEPSQGISG